MTRKLLIVVAAAMIVLAVVTVALWPTDPPTESRPRAIVNGVTFQIEIADTDATRERGLGGRTSLPADRGMLFVFEKADSRHFWMKDCYMAIDIAFLDDAGRIINLETMAMEPDPTNPRPWSGASAAARAKYVLETIGGTWKRIDAKPGMQVEFIDIPGAPQPRRSSPPTTNSTDRQNSS